ncbi:MAG TPA: PaaI family thioesterase [Gaiellaceae bacterium]|nr:PaaI family thioesterase [Gaiellaceae bacterium]
MPPEPERDARLTELALGAMPFARLLGFEVVDGSGPDEVRARLAWREDLCTTGGVLHGGALMALADSAGAVCAFLNLPQGAGTATIESKTNFFAGVSAGHLLARSRPLHRGRTTVVVETDLFDDGGRHVARVTQTQAVLEPRSA